jgi:glycosyltransferase involved in cell wall biosynthesis
VRVSFDARLAGFPGIGRFIVGLWGALLSEHDDLAVLGPRRAAVDFLGDVGYPRPGPTLPVGPRPLFGLEQLALPWLLARERIDVHHSPHLTVPYATRRPVVLTVHDLFLYKEPKKARSTAAGLYYRTVFPLAVRRADIVVGGSKYASEEVQDVFRVAPSKVRTVDYGLDHAHWRRPSTAAVDGVLARLRVRRPYLLYVGTAKRHKNLATLLAAHSRDAELPTLVLAGPTAAELAASAPGGGAGNVRVLGRIADADLPALYAGAVALLLPSLYESVGFTALEAMACGTPVVASDSAGLPVSVGDAGVLVPPTDVTSWLEALRRITSDGSLRDVLAARGSEKVAVRSWANAARSYRAIYEELAP